MGILDQAVSGAKQVLDTAGRKTGTAVELSRLKLQLMQLRSQVQSTYERIGTLTYEQQKTGTDNYDLIVVCIQEVDELLVEINEINARISEIKDGVVCARCHTVNPAGTAYCKSCGNRLKKSKEKE